MYNLCEEALAAALLSVPKQPHFFLSHAPTFHFQIVSKYNGKESDAG